MRKSTPLLLALASLLLALATACESSGGTAASTSGNSDTSGGSDTRDEGTPAACAPFSDRVPAAPATLAADVEEFGFGACGHLALTTPDDVLRLADPALTEAEDLAVGASRVTLSDHGARLAWWVHGEGDRGTLETRDLVTGADASRETAGFADYVLTGGADGGTVVTCERGDDESGEAPGGAFALVEGEWRRVEAGDGSCRGIWAAPRADRFVFATADGALHHAAVDDETAGTVPDMTWDAGTTEPDGAFRRDALRLSPDGDVLVHHVIRDVPCGDTFCPTPNEAARIVDLVDGTRVGDVSGRLSTDGLDGAQAMLAAGTGHRLVFPGRQKTTVLDDDLSLRSLDGVEVLRVLGAGPLALAKQDIGEPFRDLVLVDIETGATERLGYDPDHLVVSAGGGGAAASTFTSACVHYPDRPDTCHTQIWALVAWSAADGARTVAQAHQPVHPRWVGESGAVLVYGGLYDDTPPESAPADAEDPAWTTRLYAPDGALVRTWDEEARLAVAARDGAVVLAVFEEADRVERLEWFDTTTGAGDVLARGRGFHLAVDPAGLRVAWSAWAEEDAEHTGPRPLVAGAVPGE